MKKRLLLSIMTIMCLHGCINDSFTEDEFMETTGKDGGEIMLMERGKAILTYNPATWQLGFNNSLKEFRVHDDNMTHYYTLRCDTMPTEEGQTIDGTLEWTTYNDNKSRRMTFNVSRMGTDGKIWLWSAKHQTGVVVVEVR